MTTQKLKELLDKIPADYTVWVNEHHDLRFRPPPCGFFERPGEHFVIELTSNGGELRKAWYGRGRASGIWETVDLEQKETRQDCPGAF